MAIPGYNLTGWRLQCLSVCKWKEKAKYRHHENSVFNQSTAGQSMFLFVNKLTLNSGAQDGKDEYHKAVHFGKSSLRFFAKLVCNSVTNPTLLKLRSIMITFYCVVHVLINFHRCSIVWFTKWASCQQVYLFICYSFALNTYYNDANQEVQLKARKSQEAMEAYKEEVLINYNTVINHSKFVTTAKFLILCSVCRLNCCWKATKKRLPIH